jgi:hypothetical protein
MSRYIVKSIIYRFAKTKYKLERMKYVSEKFKINYNVGRR